MLTHRASLIELEGVPGTPDESPDAGKDGGTRLCERCQRFDLQSFARDASHRRRGYALRDVERGASESCDFYALLLDSLAGVAKPVYFSTTLWGRQRPRNPEFFVYLSVSENYAQPKPKITGPGLRANHLLTEIGDYDTTITSVSPHELCLVADSC
jgi:hypothetical protein